MTFDALERLSLTLVSWLNGEADPPEYPMCNFERIRYELRPCDVILVEGRSRVSNVIRMITSSPWTHTALYLGRLHDIEDPNVRATVAEHYPCEPDTQVVIESMLGKGTVIHPLSFYERDHIRICRPKGLAHKDAQEVIRYGVSRLGTDYDVRQIFDLARFLFPWFMLPRKWRSTLFERNAGRSTRTVCSTMIAEAFAFIQFPILPLVKRTGGSGVQLFRRNPKMCVPSDFDYSPYFEIIKYPFIDFTVHSSYRLLPWKGSGVLDGDEAQMYVANDLHSDNIETHLRQRIQTQMDDHQISDTEETPAKSSSNMPEIKADGGAGGASSTDQTH